MKKIIMTLCLGIALSMTFTYSVVAQEQGNNSSQPQTQGSSNQVQSPQSGSTDFRDNATGDGPSNSGQTTPNAPDRKPDQN